MSVGILESVSALLDLSEVSAAHDAMRRYFHTATPEDLATVIACADMLHQRPRTGVAKLRNAWQRATDERARATIAACGKAAATATRAEQVTEPDRAPRWTEDNKYQAPSEVHREYRPELRQQPRKRPEHEPRTVRHYFDNRAGVDDEPAPRERPDGYAIDYDRAAIAPQRGTSCVACFIERPSAAWRASADDGLCEDCRDDGRPGITTNEGDHRAGQVRARCDYLATHYPKASRTLMRADWRHAVTRADRDTITGWVKRNDAPTVQRRSVIPGPRQARRERVIHEPALA